MDLKTAKAIVAGRDLRPEAKRFLASKERAKAEARRRSRARTPRAAPGKTRAQRREERLVALPFLRAGALERSKGACEFCMGSLAFGWEFHHIIGGSARQEMERSDTVSAICIPCHRAWNAGDLETYAKAKTWALRHGFRDALRAIEKRIRLALAAPSQKHPARRAISTRGATT